MTLTAGTVHDVNNVLSVLAGNLFLLTENLRGKAKETVGGATGDESLERQGKKDQSKSDLKQAGEKVKDAFNK